MYAAPEVMRSKQSDIFSLGLMTLELLMVDTQVCSPTELTGGIRVPAGQIRPEWIGHAGVSGPYRRVLSTTDVGRMVGG